MTERKAITKAQLQDPPEVVAEMLTLARGEGVDVVYGVRDDRHRLQAGYGASVPRDDADRLRHRAPPDAGDLRLMSRATVDAVNALLSFLSGQAVAG